ncbi:MAG: class I SAM-dependent rRNA methyltransferase [Burkholderiales bacterium]|nr:class I SAM-dependent rRNA methyltransferase [Burkholderiales bacterium]
MRASPRRRSTPGSTSSTSRRPTTRRTPGRSARRSVAGVRRHERPRRRGRKTRVPAASAVFSSSAAKLVLKPGREKSLKRHHPWVYSGAVATAPGGAGPGETVAVHSASGEFLALAAWSPASQIVARVWAWKQCAIDRAFLHDRVAHAVALRSEAWREGATDAMRLLHAESDGLPGVIADRYAGTIVLQLTSAGAERWREEIADALIDATGAARVWERSDAEVRELEGLRRASGPLRGPREPTAITVHEHGLRYEVDLEHGHKTGFYLDQRENRRRVRSLARGRDVLDAFCYTGGFALSAAAGGARSVLALDISAEALERAQANAVLNGLPGVDWIAGDVFKMLRRLRDERREFDLVVLDPPKFAPTAAHAEKAARGYKDINLLAFKLLRPGGLLVTFSCSGGVPAELFQKILAGAALDAGAKVQLIEKLGAGPDHPVALNFPEGDYLKGLVCRVAR